MTYRVEDRLDLFDFHDTELSLVSFDKNELVISTKHLNIHKDAKENPHECDMEIDFAKLVFTQFEVISFEPMRTYQIDDDGNWYTDEPFCSIAIAGGIPSISSTSGLDIRPRNCLAYDERLSANLLWPSAKRVSKARDDFPEPEMPVITTNFPRGISTVTSLRLLTFALLTTIFPSSFITYKYRKISLIYMCVRLRY